VSTKLTVLETLLGKVEQADRRRRYRQHVPAAAGHRVGKSLYEVDMVETAAPCSTVEAVGRRDPLPTHVVVAKEFSASAEADVKLVAQVAAGRHDSRHRPDTASALLGAQGREHDRLERPGRVSSSTSSAKARVSLQAVAAQSRVFVAGGGDTIERSRSTAAGDILYISNRRWRFPRVPRSKDASQPWKCSNSVLQDEPHPIQAARGECLTRRTNDRRDARTATDTPGRAEEIIRAGADVLRVNFSHGGRPITGGESS